MNSKKKKKQPTNTDLTMPPRDAYESHLVGIMRINQSDSKTKLPKISSPKLDYNKLPDLN